jgi:putative protease
MPPAARVELVCPAGTLPALKAAVDHGADCVYFGFRNETNARNFGGLNFDARAAAEGVRYAHARGRKVLLALNTYAQPGWFERWTGALNAAADLGVDAVMLADPGLMRCALSSYTTGEGPNTVGVCSPAKAVRWQETGAGLEVRLNGVLLHRFTGGEKAGYPTLCKGRYAVRDDTYHAIEEPTSLNTLELLPELVRIGVAAVKIEGRQRSPAYVASVTRVWRAAIDACTAAPSRFAVRDAWMDELASLSEGRQTTLGAYHRPWR